MILYDYHPEVWHMYWHKEHIILKKIQLYHAIYFKKNPKKTEENSNFNYLNQI